VHNLCRTFDHYTPRYFEEGFFFAFLRACSFRSFSANSASRTDLLDTLKTDCVNDLKRPIGESWGGSAFTAALSRFRELDRDAGVFISGQLFPSEPLANNRGSELTKPVCICALALIEAERLFVKVTR
jgi:hypothetical protein